MGRIGYRHTSEAIAAISASARLPRPRTPISERLAKHSARDPTTGCLVWTGAGSKAWPYRIIKIREGMNVAAKLVHRVAYEAAYGPIPVGLFVCHRCDNPKCIEPTHLFLGTQSDNMADCWAKGRGYAVGAIHRGEGGKAKAKRMKEQRDGADVSSR